MSYDLSICSDERCSKKITREKASKAIWNLPRVTANGETGFAFDERPRSWMEIDIVLLDLEGDVIDQTGDESEEVNCIQLHVPDAFYRPGTFEHDYLPTALEIGRRLGWKVIDEQTQKILSEAKAKPWWRFW